MDSNILNTKLLSLARCIHRIEDTMPQSLEQLRDDIDMQDIIVLNLERAVQVCVDIGIHILLDYATGSPATMADTFRVLARNGVIPLDLAKKLAHAVSFRNLAVHQYQDINWEIVMSIITKDLDDFRAFAGCVGRLVSPKA